MLSNPQMTPSVYYQPQFVQPAPSGSLIDLVGLIILLFPVALALAPIVAAILFFGIIMRALLAFKWFPVLLSVAGLIIFIQVVLWPILRDL